MRVCCDGVRSCPELGEAREELKDLCTLRSFFKYVVIMHEDFDSSHQELSKVWRGSRTNSCFACLMATR